MSFDSDQFENAPHMADDPPPVLGTWTRVYVFVLIYVAVVISLFAAFSRAFQA